MFRFTDNLIGQMTLQCNMHCKYCYEGQKVKLEKKIISLEDFKEALDTCLYQRCILGSKENKFSWHFHGGEPLLYNWEDFKQAVEYVEKRKLLFPNLTWCIQSNGTLVNDEIAYFFAKKGASFGFSWDGYGDNERGTADENRRLIEKLEVYAKKYGTKFGCLSTFSRSNMHSWFSDMRSVSSWVDSFGINLLCADKDHLDLVPDADECWEYWFKPCLESYLTDNPLKERLIQMIIENFITDNILITNKTEENLYKTGCFDRVCGHGVNMISIDPDLNVFNCDKYMEEGPFISSREHCTLKDRDFLGLQQVKRYVNYLTSVFKEENRVGCDTCYASNLCIGDCQSYRLSQFGEVMLNKDMCSLYKKAYSFLALNWPDILQKMPVGSMFPIRKINPTALKDLTDLGLKPVINNIENTICVVKASN